jgi:hypothetical protein
LSSIRRQCPSSLLLLSFLSVVAPLPLVALALALGVGVGIGTGVRCWRCRLALALLSSWRWHLALALALVSLSGVGVGVHRWWCRCWRPSWALCWPFVTTPIHPASSCSQQRCGWCVGSVVVSSRTGLIITLRAGARSGGGWVQSGWPWAPFRC